MKAFSEAIEYQEILDTSHFNFMQICRSKTIEILAEEGAEFVSQDGAKKIRAKVHKELYHIISEFIQAHKI